METVKEELCKECILSNSSINSQYSSFQSRFCSYDVKNVLGSGSFGMIFHVLNRENQKEYALKQIPTFRSEASSIGLKEARSTEVMRNGEIYSNETNCMSSNLTKNVSSSMELSTKMRITHKNVIKFNRYYWIGHGGGEPNEPGHTFIEMELCHQKDLEKWIEENPTIDSRPLPEMKAWIKQLLLALEWLHRHGIIHRDLKPNNIFFSLKSNYGLGGTLKIGDFGMIERCHENNEFGPSNENKTTTGGSFRHRMSYQSYGNEHYSAPELSQVKTYNNKVDVFSLGIIAAELICPYKTDREAEDANRAFKQSRVPSPLKDLENQADSVESREKMKTVIDFLMLATKPNNKKRPWATDLLKHFFFNENTPLSNNPDEGKDSRCEQCYCGYRRVIEIVKKLGHGSFGSVFHAHIKSTRNEFAMKQIDIPRDQLLCISKFVLETVHENCIGFLQSFYYDHFYDIQDGHWFILMELCHENTLGDWLKENRTEGSRPLENMKMWIYQILSALACLHEKGIIHRDLQPDNIFFARNSYGIEGTLKIGDFKMIERCLVEDQTVIDERKMFKTDALIGLREHLKDYGSKLYNAPEKSTMKYDNRVDVFALGLIAIQFIVSLETDSELKVVFDNLRQGQLPNVLNEKLDDVKDFVMKATEPNYLDRPFANNLLNEFKNWNVRNESDVKLGMPDKTEGIVHNLPIPIPDFLDPEERFIMFVNERDLITNVEINAMEDKLMIEKKSLPLSIEIIRLLRAPHNKSAFRFIRVDTTDGIKTLLDSEYPDIEREKMLREYMKKHEFSTFKQEDGTFVRNGGPLLVFRYLETIYVPRDYASAIMERIKTVQYVLTATHDSITQIRNYSAAILSEYLDDLYYYATKLKQQKHLFLGLEYENLERLHESYTSAHAKLIPSFKVWLTDGCKEWMRSFLDQQLIPFSCGNAILHWMPREESLENLYNQEWSEEKEIEVRGKLKQLTCDTDMTEESTRIATMKKKLDFILREGLPIEVSLIPMRIETIIDMIFTDSIKNLYKNGDATSIKSYLRLLLGACKFLREMLDSNVFFRVFLTDNIEKKKEAPVSYFELVLPSFSFFISESSCIWESWSEIEWSTAKIEADVKVKIWSQVLLKDSMLKFLKQNLK